MTISMSMPLTIKQRFFGQTKFYVRIYYFEKYGNAIAEPEKDRVARDFATLGVHRHKFT